MVLGGHGSSEITCLQGSVVLGDHWFFKISGTNLPVVPEDQGFLVTVVSCPEDIVVPLGTLILFCYLVILLKPLSQGVEPLCG